MSNLCHAHMFERNCPFTKGFFAHLILIHQFLDSEPCSLGTKAMLFTSQVMQGDQSKPWKHGHSEQWRLDELQLRYRITKHNATAWKEEIITFSKPCHLAAQQFQTWYPVQSWSITSVPLTSALQLQIRGETRLVSHPPFQKGVWDNQNLCANAGGVDFASGFRLSFALITPGHLATWRNKKIYGDLRYSFPQVQWD